MPLKRRIKKLTGRRLKATGKAMIISARKRPNLRRQARLQRKAKRLGGKELVLRGRRILRTL